MNHVDEREARDAYVYERETYGVNESAKRAAKSLGITENELREVIGLYAARRIAISVDDLKELLK